MKDVPTVVLPTALSPISLCQVGVPKSIALNLTVPELVTAFNMEELAQLVARGPLEHPGARYGVKDDFLGGGGGLLCFLHTLVVYVRLVYTHETCGSCSVLVGILYGTME